MTDEAIAELYWLAVEARAAGQNVIPVHVFPARMHPQGMAFLRRTFERDTRLIAFWENLREGYDWFETNRTLPVVRVDPAGRYVFAAPAAPEGQLAGAPAADTGLLGEEVVPAQQPSAGATSADYLPSASELPAATEPVVEEVAAPVEQGTVDGPLGAQVPATTP